MKLRFLNIGLVLASIGCTAQVGVNYNTEKYTNVPYQCVRNDNYYNVKYAIDQDNIKEWNVAPSNVYYVFYDYYIYDDDNHIIYNEFYVKGTSYSLFVYKKQWFIGVINYLIFVLIAKYGTSFFIG